MRCLSITLAVILVGNLAIAQEQGGIPEEAAKELGYLVGSWNFEGKIGDDVMAGTVSVQMGQRQGEIQPDRVLVVRIRRHTCDRNERHGVERCQEMSCGSRIQLSGRVLSNVVEGKVSHTMEGRVR